MPISVRVSTDSLATIHRAYLWVLKWQFGVGPWLAYVASAAMLTTTAVLAAMSSLLALVFAIAFVASLIPVNAWLKARRRSDQAVFFLARFGDEHVEHAGIAEIHLNQLARRLGTSAVLRDKIDLRVIDAPVSQRAARRILRWTSGRAVVSGSGLVVGGQARWEAWMLLRWRQFNAFTALDRDGLYISRNLRFIRTAPSLAGIRPDGEVPITTLTAVEFSADHATGIEAAVAVLSGIETTEDPAELLVPHMPTEVRAVWENGRAINQVRTGVAPLTAARSLEERGDSSADHPLLWNTCATLLLRAEQVEAAPTGHRLRVARKALAVNPNDAVANLHVGILLTYEDESAAIAHLERALVSPRNVPGRREAGERLATIYHRKGDTDAEVNALVRAWVRSDTPLSRFRMRRKIKRWERQVARPT
jgi:hypothetical protein